MPRFCRRESEPSDGAKPGIICGAEDAVRARRGRDRERRAQRGVQRVAQVVAEAVVSERRARVECPAVLLALPAAGRGVVRDDGAKLGQEAERIDLLPVALAVGVPPEAVAGAQAMAVSAERVELAVAPERIIRRPERENVLLES